MASVWMSSLDAIGEAHAMTGEQMADLVGNHPHKTGFTKLGVMPRTRETKPKTGYSAVHKCQTGHVHLTVRNGQAPKGRQISYFTGCCLSTTLQAARRTARNSKLTMTDISPKGHEQWTCTY